MFSMQSDDYRQSVLPPGVPLLVIDAGVSLGWRSYVGPRIAMIGVDSFGASAPGPIVMEHYALPWRMSASKLTMSSGRGGRSHDAGRNSHQSTGSAIEEQLARVALPAGL